jgi:hypothetical protein
MNLTTDLNGNIIAWGIAVKDPKKKGVLFIENVELPIDFDGANYIYKDGFIEIENTEQA